MDAKRIIKAPSVCCERDIANDANARHFELVLYGTRIQTVALQIFVMFYIIVGPTNQKFPRGICHNIFDPPRMHRYLRARHVEKRCEPQF